MKKQFMRITKAHNTKHRIMMTTIFSLFSLLIYADNYVYVCTGEGAYCKTNSETAKTYSDEYSWMIEQMKLHVGEPELKEIKIPIWGWCEFSTISEEEAFETRERKYGPVWDTECSFGNRYSERKIINYELLSLARLSWRTCH